MNSTNQLKLPGGVPPAVLLILGIILTGALLVGIKYLTRGDSNGAQDPSSGQADIFKEDIRSEKDLGYTPLSRSEATSGDSLDIFKQTNSGYAADESSSTAQTQQPAPQAPAKAPVVPQPKKPAAEVRKKTGQTTVIPRIKGIKPFRTATPSQSMPKGTEMTPDIGELMKQAQQKRGEGD